jgi:hypothetical protein
MKQLKIINDEEFKVLMDKIDSIITSITPSKQKNNLNEDWLNQSEARTFLNVSNRTLQNYRDNGLLSFSKVGRKIKYKKIDVESLLQHHYVKGFTK